MRQHPTARWLAVLTLAVVTGAIVSATVGRADAARGAWGASRPVAVARHHLDAGTVLGAADITVAQWPLSVAPRTALSTAPIGRTLLAAVDEGDPFTAARVAPDGVSGIAALVPAGWRAVAIPLPPTGLALRVGDHVDLVAGQVAGVDPSVASGPSTGAIPSTVARNVIVVAVDQRAVTVALPANVVEVVAGAVLAGAVQPVLRSAR